MRVGTPGLGPAVHMGVRGHGKELCVDAWSGPLSHPSGYPCSGVGLPAAGRSGGSRSSESSQTGWRAGGWHPRLGSVQAPAPQHPEQEHGCWPFVMGARPTCRGLIQQILLRRCLPDVAQVPRREAECVPHSTGLDRPVPESRSLWGLWPACSLPGRCGHLGGDGPCPLASSCSVPKLGPGAQG